MFRLSMILFFFAYYLLADLGVNLGYHRVLSHRSLRLPTWLEHVLVTIGLPAGTPIQWAGNHRFHHAHADTPLDPHSPVHRGFWFAHVGWYIGSDNPALCLLYAFAGPLRLAVDAFMRPRTNQQYNHFAGDVASDPYYRWISRPGPYATLMSLYLAIPTSIAYWIWGFPGIAILWITSVALYNMGDAIDSISHMVGDRLPGQTDSSRNSWIMGLLILGEGWHANHHRFPGSAKHGLARGQFDWTWQVISLLRVFGLARDIRLPVDVDLRGQ
jgi:stearoyl-CoA desaturase (delta-9 desaturase)